jgi:hypothetical protein
MSFRSGRRADHSVLGVAALLAACAVAPAVFAQASSTTQADSAYLDNAPENKKAAGGFGLVPDRFTINLGAYLPNVQTHAALSTLLHNGTNIDFDHRLGLTPTTTSFDVAASWRISQHNYLAFDYFSFTRSSTKTLSDSIVWGGDVYHAGATLNVKNAVDYYGLTYRYYIWREKNWELGPGFGIDAMNLSSTICVAVSASDSSGGIAGDSAVKKGSFLAPLPMLGIFGDWEFVPRVLVRGAFQYVYVNDIAGVGGHVTDDGLGVEWYPLLNFGVGANYHYLGMELSHTSSTGNRFTGNYVIQGPALYLIATF